MKFLREFIRVASDYRKSKQGSGRGIGIRIYFAFPFFWGQWKECSSHLFQAATFFKAPDALSRKVESPLDHLRGFYPGFPKTSKGE